MSVLTKLREQFPVLDVPEVKAEARVAIAQNVIEILEIGSMVAAITSGYFSPGNRTAEARKSYEAFSLSVRRKGKTKCRVCAIGAVCLAAVGLYDDAEVLEKEYGRSGILFGADNMRDVLARWFSRKQLDLIECAYECCADYDEGGSSFRSRQRAEAFGRMYLYPRERLEAIMQNVVDNGRFIP